MSIWTKSIEEIGIEDVQGFCSKRIRENQQVEYKVQWPSQSLAKWLCAFANSNGGVIFLGVSEDSNGYPSAVPGMDINMAKPDSVDGEAWRVTPPLFGLVEVSRPIVLTNSAKAVLVIRVMPGLSDVPFSVDGVTYVRTDGAKRAVQDDQSRRVGLATPDEFIRLLRRREVAVRNREELLKLRMLKPPGRGLLVEILPEFPTEPSLWPSLAAFEDTTLSAAILADSQAFGRAAFPCVASSPLFQRIHRGLLFSGDSKQRISTERWGLIAVQSVGFGAGFGSGEDTLNLSRLAYSVYLAACYAANLCQKLDIYSRLQVKILVTGTKGISPLVPSPNRSNIRPLDVDFLCGQCTVDSAHLIHDPIGSIKPSLDEVFYVTGAPTEKVAETALCGLQLKDSVNKVIFENGKWSLR